MLGAVVSLWVRFFTAAFVTWTHIVMVSMLGRMQQSSKHGWPIGSAQTSKTGEYSSPEERQRKVTGLRYGDNSISKMPVDHKLSSSVVSFD